jgi:hypothetical protein
MEHGRELARLVEKDPELKRVLKPLFLRFGLVALSRLSEVDVGTKNATAAGIAPDVV